MRRAVAVTWIASLACTVHPPRATVAISRDDTGRARNAVLVLPTTCVADERLCTPASYVRDADGHQRMASAASFPAVIDPLVRLKLELAGFSLADAATLRLETAEREDRSTTAGSYEGVPTTSTSTAIGDAPTILSLPPGELRAAASSIGLHAILSSTLRIHPAEYGHKRFEVTLELRAIPEDTVLWTVTCAELVEQAEGTAQLLANCVGDGVLAAHAPDALIRKAL